jgi:small GTP-binding protein
MDDYRGGSELKSIDNSKTPVKVAVLKIILVGDVNVGKTNIIEKYINNDYSSNYISTIGVGLKTNCYYVDGIKVKEQIWDTAGSEKYQAVSGVYYKGAHGAIIVYDITRRDSFLSLSKWLDTLKQYLSEEAEIFIVGNKSDLEHKREVTKEEVNDFIEREGINYILYCLFDYHRL